MSCSWVVGARSRCASFANDREARPMNAKHDPIGPLTITDLRLVARARGLDVPADAKRDEIIALLGGHDAPGDTVATAQNSTRRAPPARTGWWTSLSVRELRTLARDHG